MSQPQLSAVQRKKLFKSWDEIDETALIKDLATKGEFIEICWEYLTSKKSISLEDSRAHFHKTVDCYVKRLLSDRLVFKAETVLENCQRNVKAFYYQFAFETTDDTTKTIVFDHIRKKNPDSFDSEKTEIEFYWHCLKDLSRFNITKDLETFLLQDVNKKQETLLKLYFYNKDILILEKIDKVVLWNFLVSTQNFRELIKWSRSSSKIEDIASCQSSTFPGFQKKYELWEVDDKMIEYAVKTVKNPPEVLKDLFAFRGHFFPEKIPSTLKRLSINHCWHQKKHLSNLPEFLHKHKLFGVMLENVVSTQDIESFEGHIMRIVCLLKDKKYESQEDFLELSITVRKFLENKYPVDNLVHIFELLSKDFENVDSFCESFKDTDNIFMQRLTNPIELRISPYDFFKKIKSIDWIENVKDMPSTPSFQDKNLNEKFGKKLKVNFLHYLKQQRSQYAVYFFLLEQLNSYSQISKSQLFSCTEIVTELVLQNYKNSDIMAHCIAFQEVLGFDTQILRNYCQLKSLTGGEDNRIEELIQKTEETIHKAERFPLKEYQAIVRVAKCGKKEAWPKRFIKEFADLDDWWKILVVCQYFDFPLNWVREISKSFKSKNIGENFLRALAFEPVSLDRINKRRPSISRQRSRNKADTSVSIFEEYIYVYTSRLSSRYLVNPIPALRY